MADAIFLFSPLALFGLLHFISCRIWGSYVFFLRSLILLFLMLIIAGVFAYQINMPVSSFLAWQFSLLSLGIVYLVVLVNVQNSTSLSAMAVVLNAGVAPAAEFSALLSRNSNVHNRLSDLVNNGLVAEENGVYRLTAKGRSLSKAALLVRAVLGLTECY